MASIFISYSRTNLQQIETLAKDLTSIGHSVWYDSALTGGQKWWDTILSKIQSSEIILVGLSNESLISEACKRELQYAVDLQKSLLPVLLSENVNLDLLLPPLSELQIVECFENNKSSLITLINALQSIPKSPPLPEDLPVPPDLPVSYLVTVKERIQSKDTLTYQEQMSIIIDLRAQVRKQMNEKEIRELLSIFKDRNDLLAKVNTEIDELLTELDQLEATVEIAEKEGSDATDGSILCKSCGTSNPEKAMYCSNCGKSLKESRSGYERPGESSASSFREKRNTTNRSYNCPEKDQHNVISATERWLMGQDFKCQQLQTEDGNLLMQIVKKGGWRQLIGMSTALNIVFRQKKDVLMVEIGEGKWLDKAVVGTVSLFVLWPLAITAGIGAWQQMKMPERILQYIGQEVDRYTQL